LPKYIEKRPYPRGNSISSFSVHFCKERKQKWVASLAQPTAFVAPSIGILSLLFIQDLAANPQPLLPWIVGIGDGRKFNNPFPLHISGNPGIIRINHSGKQIIELMQAA
jgi:hypothetical protein